jgi:hypothetical protein
MMAGIDEGPRMSTCANTAPTIVPPRKNGVVNPKNISFFWSHVSHTPIDRTPENMGFYAKERNCVFTNFVDFFEKNDSGGGTRTPDTRIMIPRFLLKIYN